MSAAEKRDDGPPAGPAFLLSQIGAHAAQRFAIRSAELGLSPPQVGLLDAIAREPGQSQQSYAALLGANPSRFVGLVDTLEERGLLERRRVATDRRTYALQLTREGGATLRRIAKIGRAHDDDILAALDADERSTLRDLLLRIADQQQLTPGVRPATTQLAGPRLTHK